MKPTQPLLKKFGLCNPKTLQKPSFNPRRMALEWHDEKHLVSDRAKTVLKGLCRHVKATGRKFPRPGVETARINRLNHETDGDGNRGESGSAMSDMHALLVGMPDGPVKMCLERMTTACFIRSLRILRGDFRVRLVPMKCFPDPDIWVEYELRCVIDIGGCDLCDDECGTEWTSKTERSLCCCRVDEDAEYKKQDEIDILKVALLFAARTQDRHARFTSCVYGSSAYVRNHRAGGKVRAQAKMPSAYDIIHGEFRYCSYGHGVMYMRVEFGDCDLDFTCSVVALSHDV
jgi:hypothetical protein